MNAVTTLLQSTGAQHLGWMLLHSVWVIALLAAIYGLLRHALRHRSANARYLAACAIMLCMLAALPLTAMFVTAPPLRTTPRHPATLDSPKERPHAADKTASLPSHARVAPASSGNAARGETVAQPLVAASMTPKTPWPTQLSHSLTPLLPWIVTIWLAGVLVLAVRQLGGWVTARRVCASGTHPVDSRTRRALAAAADKLGIRSAVELLASVRVEVPSVIGHIKPVILLPVSMLTGMSSMEIEALLAHELAHIRRHDYLANLIQTAIETVLFYHPAIWWLSREIRLEREHCCDDLAVHACGDRIVYARALTSLEAQRATIPATAMAASGGSLLERIRRIVGSPTGSHTHRGTWLAGAIALLSMAALLPIALGVGDAQSDHADLKTPPAAHEKANEVTAPLSPSTPGHDSIPDDTFVERYARALAAGDFKVLSESWEFEDDLERQLGQRLAASFAEADGMRVAVASSQRLGENRLFACFVVNGGPEFLGGQSSAPFPLFVTFFKRDAHWRCAPVLDARFILNARTLGHARLGRRQITHTLIARRFSQGRDTGQVAARKAQRDAVASLAREPHNLTHFEGVAETLTDTIPQLEQQSQTTWQEWLSLMMDDAGDDALPQPGDFVISFYLEADDDTPHSRVMPFADSDDTIRLEPFPCLTDSAILEAHTKTGPYAPTPQVEIVFNRNGTRILKAVTEQNLFKRLAIVSDGKVLLAPKIQDTISAGRVVITGSMSAQESTKLANELNAYRHQLKELIDRLGTGNSSQESSHESSAPEPAGQETKLAESTQSGKPIKGVRVTLENANRMWGRSDWPHPVLHLAYRAENKGQYILHLPENGLEHQVEVDGQWYEWVDPPHEIEAAGESYVSRRAGTLLDFKPESHWSRQILLAGNWLAIPKGKEVEYAVRRHGGGWTRENEEHGGPLILTPGPHQIRVAIISPSTHAPFQTIIRAESNALAIQVDLPGASQATELQLDITSTTNKPTYTLNGKPVPAAELGPTLTEQTRNRKDMPLRITVDSRASHQQVVLALDAVKAAGLVRVSVENK